MEIHRIFNRARIDDRLANELIGIARGLVADGKINQREAEYLQTWLAANEGLSQNPLIATLLHRVSHMLRDGHLDEGEASELFDTLHRFTGGDTVLGEINKASTLPLDQPAPPVQFAGRQFCFTGTFAYGTRAECEAAVANLGGSAGGLTQKTHYLVIGIYATDSWAHSAYGRKIEKALAMKAEGAPILIIGEQHWLQQGSLA
jgi:NAD-dependent DNA ligase